MPSLSHRRELARPLTALAALIAVLGLVGCSSNASTPAASPAPSASTTGQCAAVPAVAAARPPADVPTPSDATFYQRVVSGATILYFAYVPGSDVRVRRDAIVGLLRNAGYGIASQDAEANAEAEAGFTGKGHGASSIQVKPRDGCDTQLRVRYRLAS